MKFLAGIVFAVFSVFSYAGTQTGKVTQILVNDAGVHYFYLEGAASGKPSCATLTYWMIKDENSTAGKSQFSILLTAQASGRPVYVVGKNTCTRWSDGEDVSFISISQ